MLKGFEDTVRLHDVRWHDVDPTQFQSTSLNPGGVPDYFVD